METSPLLWQYLPEQQVYQQLYASTIYDLTQKFHHSHLLM
ncbi:hypothetical protein AB97_3420 [Escherichia coli 1-110-08_S3_C1]|nr:hypothetical protein AB97_3420 [Escherichia coli 1-110-08_S3_C1]